MDNKIVIITGGTGALGRFIVEKYAREGWKVYLPVSSLKKFTNIFDNSQDEESDFILRKIYAFDCDVLNENSVVKFVSEVSALENGRIDVLINTVGGFPDALNIEDYSTNEFDKWFDLNFKTTFWFSREVIKVMKKNNYGRIFSISSIAGLKPMEGRISYSVSKSAVIDLMETINMEYKDIRGYAIVPTVIDTPANRKWGTEEEIMNWVKPEDIADLIYYQDPFEKSTVIKIGKFN